MKEKIGPLIQSKLFIIIFLALVGFGIYYSNLHNALFWDDDDWIINNPFVHSFGHLKEIFTQNILSGFGLNSNYYRPFLLLTFAFNYIIGGIKPLGYHLVSNGFHIANGILVFSILYSVLKKRLPAFIASLLFLIHPLQTEAVTYISGRGDPMSVFFMLLSLWLFAKRDNFLSTPRSDLVYQGRTLYGVLSVLSMILAVLSRETAILTPLLIMIFYIAFLSKENFMVAVRKAFIKTLPYWVISAVYWLLRLTILNFQNTLNFYSEVNDYSSHLIYRLFTFGEVLIGYFKLIFAPIGLHMERDMPIKTSLLEWPVWLAILIVIVIVGVGILFYKKQKINNQQLTITNSRIWLFGWAWFFVALGPVSGIIPINAVMYEHWLYIPLIGFFTLVGFYVDSLWEWLGNKKLTVGRILLVAGVVVYFSFFAVASFRRNIVWGDPIKFYQDILKYNPNTVRIINNLGNLYSARGETDKAIEEYKKAITIPNGNLFAQPHYNLGNIYRDKGDIEKAIVEYKEAIKIDPSFPFAYQNLAVIYAGRGKLIEAAEMLEKVKELRPLEPRVYYNLALIYFGQNKKDLGIKNLELALERAGNDPVASAEISRLLNQIKR